MATPTRSQAVSTPKNPLTLTPNRPVASPRPSTANTGQKTLAYKSPAVKTPASLHGHGHHVSVSSQPSSTPLAGVAIHDEILALNSPATALINSIAPTGLTPLSTAQDGLGITQLAAAGARDGSIHKNPEAERLQRILQVADTLKTKIIGRGITRDGVERVARLQGFEPLWDEDNLTIAGNAVELDINFEHDRKDKVRDLTLKLNGADGEPQVQHQASDILKKDVGVGVGLTLEQPTIEQDLSAFSKNLQYLSRLDHVDANTNCFEIIGGLYSTFRKIWDEEKKKKRWRDDTLHYCNGNVGRASMDRMPNVGLSLDYWRDRQQDAKDPSDDDLESSHSTTDAGDPNSVVRTGRIYCEAGNPSITTAQKWTSDEVLVQGLQPEHVLDSEEQSWIPAWRNPLEPLNTESSKVDGDQMDIDKPTSGEIPQSLNICFVYALEPPVLLPINTVMSLNNEVHMLTIDQIQATTYQQALQTLRNKQISETDPNQIESRWTRSLSFEDASNEKSTIHQHSYGLYSATVGTELWFYPVSKLSFNHPKQLAAVLPTLRQQALLWSLMKSLVMYPSPKTNTITQDSVKDVTKQIRDRKQVVKRSNVRKTPTKANTVLPGLEGILPIDISLDVISDLTKPRLDVFMPVFNQAEVASAVTATNNNFIHLALTIDLNAKLEVLEIEGLRNAGESGFKSKLARMLTLSEDLGMVLQWVVEQNMP